MFSIDFPEIVIIMGVALVVLGPKKLPGAAAKIGRWVGRARSMARQFREQLEQEVSSVENAADIRSSIDSVGEPARKQSAAGAPEAGPPPAAAPRESVPPEAVAQGTSSHAPGPNEPMPYETGPYESMPPEGYDPAPQQLTFDAQLHDTALPPEGVSSSAAADSHPADVREWMPETQTWMASAGWEVPEPAAPQSTPSTPRQATGQHPSPHERAPEPAATPSSRPEAVEHDDR